MTREQAINYLFSCGFTNEQVGEVVRALTYEPARLSVDEVTALAEWTEKLTKASEDAYNKGYADGMNDQELILDRIRAEIEGILPTYHNPDWSITDLVPISEVLKRVDKYKAKTEET